MSSRAGINCKEKIDVASDPEATKAAGQACLRVFARPG